MDNPYLQYVPKREVLSPKKQAFVDGLYKAMDNGMDYREITVSDLCRFSGLSRTTFYYYYNNVQDVLDDLENAVICNFNQITDIFTKDKHTEELKDDITEFVRYLLTQENTYYKIFIKYPHRKFVNAWKNQIKYAFFPIFENRRDYDFALDVIASSIISAVQYLLTNPDKYSFEEYSDSIYQLHKYMFDFEK